MVTGNKKEHGRFRKAQLTGYTKMAKTKYENYIKYSLIWPELIFIFIGDTGQGDIDTALMMMNNNRGNVLMCFIHNIIQAKRRRKIRKYRETDFIYNIYSNDIRSKLKRFNIYLFDTYADVFAKLYTIKIMTDSNKKKFNKNVYQQLAIDKKYFKSDILYKIFIKNIKRYLVSETKQ